MPLDIVYEDRYLLVINKRPGLLVVPTHKNERHTLTNLLREELQKRDPPCMAYPCHRLDRDTSGLIIYAKTKPIRDNIMKQFKEGKIKKTYIAFVQGRISKKEGTIGYAIEGKNAVTQYKVIYNDARGFSVVEIRPITGRTNQIRIHFRMIGHPLLGERKFAFGKDYPLKFRRTALHATEIKFSHPVTREPLVFKTRLYKDMQDFLDKKL